MVTLYTRKISKKPELPSGFEPERPLIRQPHLCFPRAERQVVVHSKQLGHGVEGKFPAYIIVSLFFSFHDILDRCLEPTYGVKVYSFNKL